MSGKIKARKYDVVATIGEYTDHDGNKKKRYLTVGSVLEREDGTLCMKLDSLPIVSEGWFNLYPPKPKDGIPAVQAPAGAASTPATGRTDDFEDEIPF